MSQPADPLDHMIAFLNQRPGTDCMRLPPCGLAVVSIPASSPSIALCIFAWGSLSKPSPTCSTPWYTARLCHRPVPRVFVHGPTGSGAAALCGSIAGKTEAVNLEIGAIVAAAVEQETDPGVEAKPFVEAGDTIPNKVLVPLVLDRLREGDCKRNGFVLRGFPKTRAQAVGLQIQGSVAMPTLNSGVVATGPVWCSIPRPHPHHLYGSGRTMRSMRLPLLAD